MISDLRKSIMDFFTDSSRTEEQYGEAAELYRQTGYALYKLLVGTVETSLGENVVVVVDKELGYLPFDLLLTELPDRAYGYRDHPYLMREHAISYSYSANLWMEMQRPIQDAGRKALVIAPSFGTLEMSAESDDSFLMPLSFNQEEASKVAATLNARTVLSDDATKERFLADCERYDLIHLATHGTSDDQSGDNSFLLFTNTSGDNQLYASEIYPLNLNAELVTLSACETGYGELRKGEGVISLARAFAFAGARGLVSTLWSVNDRSTSQVMTSYYRYLGEGLDKSNALRQAKLDYINSVGHADAHPFFWGGFISIGNIRPLQPYPSRRTLNALLLLIIFGILVWVVLPPR